MDLMRKIKKILIVISIPILFSMFSSCFKNSEKNADSTFENLARNTCIEMDKTYEIKLRQNIKYDYDKLYIFEGPRFPSEIEEITNIKYNDLLDDDYKLYLFVKNKVITKQEKSSSNDINIHRLMNEQGYAVLLPETILFTKKRKNGNDVYYDIFYK